MNIEETQKKFIELTEKSPKKAYSMILNVKDDCFFNNKVMSSLRRMHNLSYLRKIFSKVSSSIKIKLLEDEIIASKLIANSKTIEQLRKIGKGNKKFRECENIEFLLTTVHDDVILDKLYSNVILQYIICENGLLGDSKFNSIDKTRFIANLKQEVVDNINTNLSNMDKLALLNHYSNYLIIPLNNKSYDLSRLKLLFGILEKRNEKIYVSNEVLESMGYKSLSFLYDKKNKIINGDRINPILKRSSNWTLIKNSIEEMTKNQHLYFNYHCSKDIGNMIALSDDVASHIEELAQYLELENIDQKFKSELMKKYIFGCKMALYSDSIYRFPSLIKSLYMIKFNMMEREGYYYNNSIDVETLLKINVKHINRIVKLFKENAGDEITRNTQIIIKLYIAFGLENACDILNGKYGKISKEFLNVVERLDVDKVQFVEENNSYSPMLNKEFINFMIGNKENSNISLIIKSETNLSNYWNEIYNDFEQYKDICNGKLSKKKLEELFNDNKVTIPSMYYYLKKDGIFNKIIIGNKVAGKNEIILLKETILVYEEMLKRKYSSIPYVEGSLENGYSYKMMNIHNPMIFILGYETDCCMRLFDIAQHHLKHAAISPNGRVLLYYNEKNDLIGFSCLKRNGEVIITNSIEHKVGVDKDKLLATYMEAMKNIFETINYSNDCLKLITIGNNLSIKPKNNMPFPSKYGTPVVCTSDLYSNTNTYHERQSVVLKDDNLDFATLRYYNPDKRYIDPREKVKMELVTLDNASDILDFVNYVDKDEKKYLPYGIKQVIYNVDWYILIFTDGNYKCSYLDIDERAKTECEIALNTYIESISDTNKKRLCLEIK